MRGEYLGHVFLIFVLIYPTQILQFKLLKLVVVPPHIDLRPAADAILTWWFSGFLTCIRAMGAADEQYRMSMAAVYLRNVYVTEIITRTLTHEGRSQTTTHYSARSNGSNDSPRWAAPLLQLSWPF